MARIIDTIRSQARDLRCVVRFDSDLSEYTVALYANGRYLPNADYFTDDRADALQTAWAMLSRAESRRLGSEFVFPLA